MRMLFGFFLCFLGVSGFFIAGLYHETVIWIISVLLLVIGVIIVFFAYKRGQRDKTVSLLSNTINQCPVCRINLANGCVRCPRCGKEF